MDLVVRASRPNNDLVHISLEHDEIGVPERGATDGGIGVIVCKVVVTIHEVIREEIVPVSGRCGGAD